MSYLRANFRVYSGQIILQVPALGTNTDTWINAVGTASALHLGISLPTGLMLMSADYSSFYVLEGAMWMVWTKDATS